MHITPSILTADMSHLGAEVEAAFQAGIDWLHLDVMDGCFVPNISFGPLMVRALRPLADRYNAQLDAHLMIADPDRYIEAFASAGADRITVHAEAGVHLHRTIQALRDLGVRPGVALNPATPLHVIEELLPDLDLILVMTVNPGFGGQRLIPACLDKVRRLRALLTARNFDQIALQVDGGVHRETIAACRDAGASVAVVGSAIYAPGQDIAGAIADLRTALAR